MKIYVFREQYMTCLTPSDEVEAALGGAPNYAEVRYGWRQVDARWVCNLVRLWADGRIEVIEEDWTRPGEESGLLALAPQSQRMLLYCACP